MIGHAPVVRPYALTGGMTRPTGERIDLIDMVRAARVVGMNVRLTPEQARVLASCQVPVALVELSADLGLATGVVRILVSDLRERGLVTIHRARPASVKLRPAAGPPGGVITDEEFDDAELIAELPARKWNRSPRLLGR